jgi:hypothetical protein
LFRWLWQEASMSKIKNFSATGWLVAGITAALLLVPTTAVAVTATTTIIQGGTAAGQASVTAAHQLLSTTVNPKAYVNTPSLPVDGNGDIVAIAEAPSWAALIVTTIHVGTFVDPTPGSGQFIQLVITTGGCPGGQVGSFNLDVHPGAIGETDIPITPGVAVPAGDILCAGGVGSVQADISVTGYTVPSSEVPAGPVHRFPALPRQHG